MENRHTSSYLGLIALLTMKAFVLLPFGTLCIWWAYSMNRVVGGGSYTFGHAILLSIALSGITTSLATLVWTVSLFLHKEQTWLGLALKTSVETAITLC